MVKINFIHFSPDLSNFLQFKPILSTGEDFLNIIRRICQPCSHTPTGCSPHNSSSSDFLLSVRPCLWGPSYGCSMRANVRGILANLELLLLSLELSFQLSFELSSELSLELSLERLLRPSFKALRTSERRLKPSGA